jgi:hypothetical protein
VEVPASGSPAFTAVGGLLFEPLFTLDSVGDIFFITNNQQSVAEQPAGGGPQVTLPFSELNSPQGLAVDDFGDVFVSEYYNNQVLELPAEGGSQVTLPFSGLDEGKTRFAL